MSYFSILFKQNTRDVAQPGSALHWGVVVVGSNPAIPTKFNLVFLTMFEGLNDTLNFFEILYSFIVLGFLPTLSNCFYNRKCSKFTKF